ncbi:MAG: prephenate dehydrogenase [Bdellovibrionales bacterium]|nr:prephenate dehydrogenase [Bdellovibrionales bacterium]
MKAPVFTPPLEKISVFGLGLIGGSLARDLRSSGFAKQIWGVDVSTGNCQKAIELGLVDKIVSRDVAVKESNFIVLAIPVDRIVEELPFVLDNMDKNSVVTDMGSTKETICRLVSDHKNRGRYVASHPMAGTEDSGPAAAIAHLFANKTAVICQEERIDREALDVVLKMYQALLMRVIFMPAEEHDRHVAFVSHLPHAISFILAQTVLDEESSDATIFELASGGFESTARLGKSSPEMWTPIFDQNYSQVLEALRSFCVKLQQLCDKVRDRDLIGMNETIQRANKIRRVLNHMADARADRQLPKIGDGSFKKSLKQMRLQIDSIDSEIVRLLGLRQKLSNSVGQLKRKYKVEAVQENRWQQVLDRCLKSARDSGLNPDFVTGLYEQIHQESLNIQRSLAQNEAQEDGEDNVKSKF